MTDKQIQAIWFPWQRSIRTALQVIAALILGTSAILGTVALVAPQILAAIADLLRPEDYALVAGWVLAISSLSAALARIMAIPQVDEFLKRFGAGSSPAGADLPDAVQTVADSVVVDVLTRDLPGQVGALEVAANRLGVDPSALTRDMYRDTLEE